ncbi:hypothetical protein ACFE04_028349 [Oxalis oulophora]
MEEEAITTHQRHAHTNTNSSIEEIDKNHTLISPYANGKPVMKTEVGELTDVETYSAAVSLIPAAAAAAATDIEQQQQQPKKKIPTTSPVSDNIELGVKKRKRCANSDFIDVNDNIMQHNNNNNNGLSYNMMMNSGGGGMGMNVATTTQQQGFLPFWPVGTYMVPTQAVGVSTNNGANPAQLWAFPATATPFFNVPAQPISNFVQFGGMHYGSSTGGVETGSTTAVASLSSTELNSGSSVSSGSSASTSKTATQLLRDFSFDCYDKKELQFMGQHGNQQ